MTIGLVVSYRINMQPSSLSNRVTTDRKDLRELLERTVLEWVHNKSLVPYLVKLFSHHTQKNIPSNPGSILYVIFPLLILSHTILFSFRVWLVPLVLLAHLDPTAPRWEYQHYPLDCKIKMSSVESEWIQAEFMSSQPMCGCVVNENSYIMFVILDGLTDWFSPIQGETGPTGPTGATGVRGAPVSTSFCNLSQYALNNSIVSWYAFGLEIENTSIFYIEMQSVLIINSRRFLFFWTKRVKNWLTLWVLNYRIYMWLTSKL